MPPKKMTTEEFKNKVYIKHGNKVEIITEYNGGTEPISIIYHCEKHGRVEKTLNAKNIFARSFQPCKECDLEQKSKSGKNRPMSKEELYKRLQNYIKAKGGKLITKTYTTAKDLYEIDCGIKEHPNFFSNADSLVNKPQWCPYCSGRKGNFEEEIKSIAESKNGTVLTKYMGASNHVKVRCNIHNYEWDITPANIKKGRWCPICNLPYSEKVVYDYLRNNKQIIKAQYGFDDLLSENKEILRFDFAIFDIRNKVIGLLEIDDNEHRYNTKQLRRLKARERDKLKDAYCKTNNISLYRLKYDNYNKEIFDYESYYKYIHNNIKGFLNNINMTGGDYYIKQTSTIL